jgi:hypothetical protein
LPVAVRRRIPDVPATTCSVRKHGSILIEVNGTTFLRKAGDSRPVMNKILLMIFVTIAAAQCAGIPPGYNGERNRSPAYEKGREDAKEDLKNGKLVYYVTGAPAPWDRLWAEMLKAEYGVTLRSGGCDPDSEHFQRAEGYNTISVPAIAEKYGEVLSQTGKRAEKEWAKQRTRSSREIKD